MVDAIDNPRTQYLINDACVMAVREMETSAMTNDINGRGGGPIPLVSGRAMGTEGQLTVYKQPIVC